MAEPKLIKVCLTNKGDDTETPWAHELGVAANAPSGSLKVKLVNVPFMHAKPTWGDTIIVSPAKDAFPTWDRDGVPWKQINSKIVEDGGRWAMIIDYKPSSISTDEAFAALSKACDAHKIVCEGAWAPRDSEPGRAYLAVQKELTADAVMGLLDDASLPVVITQIHPEPKKKVARAGTQVGISDEAGRPPAKPARAKTEKPIEAEAPPKRAATQPPVKAAKPAPPAKPAAKAAPAAKPASNGKAVAAKPGPAKAAKPEKSAPTKAAAKPASNAKITPAKPAPKAAAKPAAKPAAKAAPAPAKKPAKKK